MRSFVRRFGRTLAAIGLLAVAAACAPPPPVVLAPGAPAHPDFVFPVAPPGTPTATVQRLDRGWRLLQSNDAAGAEREFAGLLRGGAPFLPAVAAQGYVELARRRPAEALAAFDRVTAVQTTYAPALVGRALALLADGKDDDALAGFEAALAADASLPDLAGRIEVLRVRQLQDRVSRAERAAAAGRWDEARDAYLAAMAASPESPFLQRDLARSEQRAGRLDSALDYARKAVALDPDDARSHVVEADVLEARGDFSSAVAAYQRAAALDPSPATSDAIARVRERARDAALPAQYHAIAASPAATRADLAALLGVRLAAVLLAAPQRALVVTDVRGHWAQPWIRGHRACRGHGSVLELHLPAGNDAAPGRRRRRRQPGPGAAPRQRRRRRALGSAGGGNRRRAPQPSRLLGREARRGRGRHVARRRGVRPVAAHDRRRRGSGRLPARRAGERPVTAEPILTLANQLTLLRLLLIPAFVLCVVYGRFGWALVIFVVAGATDALDGLIARRANQRTSLGAWLDPAADKLLLVTTFIVLTLPNLGLPNRVPLWLTISSSAATSPSC